MIRDTSTEAYNSIIATGLIQKLRKEVFDFVWLNWPCTEKSAWKKIAPSRATGCVVTRFSELERMGVIEPCGDTIDPDSGMRVMLWGPTGKMPNRLKTNKKVSSYIQALDDLKSEMAKRFILCPGDILQIIDELKEKRCVT